MAHLAGIAQGLSPVRLRLLLLQLLLEPRSKGMIKKPEKHMTTTEPNLQKLSASSSLSFSELLDVHLVEVDLVLHSAQGLLLKFAHLARLLLLQPAERPRVSKEGTNLLLLLAK